MHQIGLPLQRPHTSKDQFVRALVCLRPDAHTQRQMLDCVSRFYDLPPETATPPERLHLTLLHCEQLHVEQLRPLLQALARIRFNVPDLSMLQPVAWSNGVAALLPIVQERVGELRDQVQLAAWRAGVLNNTHSPKTAHITVSREAHGPLQLECPVRLNWMCRGFELVHSPAYPAPYREIARYAAMDCGSRPQ